MASVNDGGMQAIKILYTGLDNAGKSSIILALLRDFEHIEHTSPTRGVKRRDYNFLGLEISEWELGGQSLYRKQYMSNQADKVFSGAEIVLFVIDIQDKERYEESIEYLAQIIEQLQIQNIQPAVYVFFHKFDPVEMMGSQAEITNASLDLRNRIKLVGYPNIKFYRTSIFNIQSIILAVSNILLSKNPRAVVLEKSIQDFAKRLELLSLVLIDDNSLLIGYYYFNKYIQDLMENVTPFFLEVNETFERASVARRKIAGNEEDLGEEEMIVRRFGYYFLFKKFRLKREGSFFHFLGCNKGGKFNLDYLQMFVNVIKEIL
ncbi:MAG: ADP-ribosylation factor-like protein [Promethearchaeota archaeon]